MARGSLKVGPYALTSFERVAAAIGEGQIADSRDNGWLVRVINAVTRLFEHGICHRQFRSRTYTHDGDISGGNLPRLDGDGTRWLHLANFPVTAISSLKRRYDEAALTEGPDSDFIVDNDTGLIELKANLFPSERAVVAVTYTGGFLDTPSAAQAARWGWDLAGAAIQQAATDTVVDLFKRRKAGDARVTALTTESGTFQLDASMLLPHVRGIVEAHRSGEIVSWA